MNILPKATLLENHALRGRNRESSTRRPPEIPYQGTDIYEKGTTLLPLQNQGRESLELLLVFNPDPSQLSLTYN